MVSKETTATDLLGQITKIKHHEALTFLLIYTQRSSKIAVKKFYDFRCILVQVSTSDRILQTPIIYVSDCIEVFGEPVLTKFAAKRKTTLQA